MRTTIGIEIDASPDLVFAVYSDVTRWERLLPHYARSRFERRHRDGSVTCRFVASRPLIGLLGVGIPVAWRSRVWRDPALRRLRFRHIGGVTAGMEVTWTLEPRSAGGTRVTIAHEFDRGPARILPRLIEHLFTRPIAGRTLATFKALAEALEAARPARAAARSMVPTGPGTAAEPREDAQPAPAPGSTS